MHSFEVFSLRILEEMCPTIRVTSFLSDHRMYANCPLFNRFQTMRSSQADGNKFDACRRLNIVVCKPLTFQRVSLPFGFSRHCATFSKPDIALPSQNDSLVWDLLKALKFISLYAYFWVY